MHDVSAEIPGVKSSFPNEPVSRKLVPSLLIHDGCPSVPAPPGAGRGKGLSVIGVSHSQRRGKEVPSFPQAFAPHQWISTGECSSQKGRREQMTNAADTDQPKTPLTRVAHAGPVPQQN